MKAPSPKKQPEVAATLKYKRVLLKLSGEALMGEQGYGIDANVLQYLADELVQVNALGTLRLVHRAERAGVELRQGCRS